ncbi:MAG TPA: Asp-tRNA(Asn)/Glu-tRNA(Gln) amidotransferase subunit GatA [Nitrososphaeraceae archaeon]|nr:Asp-tRNA(Asn)/Glu-tRNA(Gln) amidotransferase subunit GatA [Nitrososphaeraceae archaeon]
MSNLYTLNVQQVTNGIKNREFTCEEYVSQLMERIRKIDNKINSFITINDNAIAEAQQIDKKIRSSSTVGSLAGIVVGVKDNISTAGLKTTCASKMLSDYIPPYDATVIKRLKDKDAIIIGKLNLDEFAMGSTTEWSHYGLTRNPWNLDYVCGGSSGGSAASIAAQLCTVSLGSDTGGSVRCPASFCSVIGFKPTYGLVSRYGLISYSNSLEQIGPIGKTVSDIRKIMEVISGKDTNDNTTIDTKNKNNDNNYYDDNNDNKKYNQKIGLLKELINGADKPIYQCIYSAIDRFNEFRFTCENSSLDSTEYALASYYTIAMAEASSNLARFDNIRYGFELNPDDYEWNTYFSKTRGNFGDEVKRRIIVGTFVLSSGYYGKYYLKAHRVRELIKSELKNLFKKYDLLISPTVPVLPFKIGEKIDDPLKMYLIDIATVLANLAGIPAISIPIGFENGLPIGLQIMADEFQEKKLLDAAELLEKSININSTYPDL